MINVYKFWAVALNLGNIGRLLPRKMTILHFFFIGGFENIKNPYGEIWKLLATSGPENHGAFYQDDIIDKYMTFDLTKF